MAAMQNGELANMNARATTMSLDSFYRRVTYSTASTQRIYSITTGADSKETLHTNDSGFKLPEIIKLPSSGEQSITVLLAPSMSPYVVPFHKVQTWDALHQALHSLFGADVFQGSPPRITDHKGATILPLLWKSLLEPDMTIIVDTYSAPVVYEPPRFPMLSFGRSNIDAETTKTESEGFESTTALILAEQESEYGSSHRKSGTGTPFSVASITPANTPHNSFKTRPTEQQQTQTQMSAAALKRQTSISMFTGDPRKAPRQRLPRGATKDLYKPATSVVHFESDPQTGHSYKVSAHAVADELALPAKVRSHYLSPASPRRIPPSPRRGQVSPRRVPLSPRRGLRRPKSAWNRVTNAVFFLLKAGGPSSTSSKVQDKKSKPKQGSLKRSISNPAKPVQIRHDGAVTVLERRETGTIPERRGVAPLAPVTPPSINEPFEFTPAPKSTSGSTKRPVPRRRTKSAGAFLTDPVSPTAPPTAPLPHQKGLVVKGHQKSKSLVSSAFGRLDSTRTDNSRREKMGGRLNGNSLSRKFSTLSRSRDNQDGSRSSSPVPAVPAVPAAMLFVSPPIPRRPSAELGVNAQYKTPGLDREQLQEYFSANSGDEGSPGALDGSTLVGSSVAVTPSTSTRANGRSPAAASAAAPPVKPVVEAVIDQDKPLPRLPFVLSPLPRQPSHHGYRFHGHQHHHSTGTVVTTITSGSSPPRTPLEFKCIGGGERLQLPDADRRPTTTESVILGPVGHVAVSSSSSQYHHYHRHQRSNSSAAAAVRTLRRVAKSAGIAEARTSQYHHHHPQRI